MNRLPCFEIDDPALATAFRIAVGDFVGNIQPWQGELRSEPSSCIFAGLDYDRPWTRDAAINSWYAASLVTPSVAEATLLSVLSEDENGVRIGGQYWDAIIWVTAAWNHYLCTGDTGFLKTAFDASLNSLTYYEENEFDADDGLFRGAACFQDGVAGYPDHYADGPKSCILAWVKAHPRPEGMPGYGLPMKALSTNCLYYNAYVCLPLMAAALDVPVMPEWTARAENLKVAINKAFWDSDRGVYRYLAGADDDGRQEGFGSAFALLFGIADAAQTASIFERQHITDHGISCLWPSYERYTNTEGSSFGRHSGTVWPQVNTAWTMAASQYGQRDLAVRELHMLAEKAVRDAQFAEIYHPVTGEMYGGMQESPRDIKKIMEWRSCRRQSWCATGYIQMVLSALFGYQLDSSGIRFAPHMPKGCERMKISGLRYGKATLSVCVESGDCPDTLINGKKQENPFVPAGSTGEISLIVKVPC